MLLHVPIVILTTFSPIAVADNVPNFDVVKECRFEGGAAVDFDRCRQDEAVALEQLKAGWAQYVIADKRTCLTTATVGGFSSYVELLSCLQMSRDANGGDSNSRSPQAAEAMQRRTPAGVTVGIGHDRVVPAQAPNQGTR
jgi:hypothetical protein